MVTRTYQVDRIHCDGCVSGIRKALEPIDGVAEARPDQDSNRVSVRFDAERIDEEVIHRGPGRGRLPHGELTHAPALTHRQRR